MNRRLEMGAALNPRAGPLLAAARGCVKTPRASNMAKNRRSHFGYGAFLFLGRVIRTTFSFFKIVFSEFSHSLAIC